MVTLEGVSLVQYPNPNPNPTFLIHTLLHNMTCVPRRMFPFVMVTLEGLSPTLLYSVHLLFRPDITALVDWA